MGEASETEFYGENCPSPGIDSVSKARDFISVHRGQILLFGICE